eukprot:gene1240-2365_t
MRSGMYAVDGAAGGGGLEVPEERARTAGALRAAVAAQTGLPAGDIYIERRCRRKDRRGYDVWEAIGAADDGAALSPAGAGGAPWVRCCVTWNCGGLDDGARVTLADGAADVRWLDPWVKGQWAECPRRTAALRAGGGVVVSDGTYNWPYIRIPSIDGDRGGGM